MATKAVKKTVPKVEKFKPVPVPEEPKPVVTATPVPVPAVVIPTAPIPEVAQVSDMPTPEAVIDKALEDLKPKLMNLRLNVRALRVEHILTDQGHLDVRLEKIL